MEAGEAFVGEARATRVAVVDEHGGQHRVRVQGGGDTADVPAVAGGQQRQQADGGVLGGVQRAGGLAGGDPQLVQHHWVDGVGHRAGDQALLWEVERDVFADGAVGKPHHVAGDPVQHLDVDAGHPQARRGVHQLAWCAQDGDVRG